MVTTEKSYKITPELSAEVYKRLVMEQATRKVDQHENKSISSIVEEALDQFLPGGKKKRNKAS